MHLKSTVDTKEADTKEVDAREGLMRERSEARLKAHPAGSAIGSWLGNALY